ncbi:hypothetical protein GJ654_20065 [Rhodoblastus acidophilus]|uniref:Uncharacterized protein n=1 Tax=Rhodoblastus acidophilus TaxID=1074 RepID=A0A6N8DTY7_RHOAC|nr:hypothetical protein [Rhodoblastus acidophilus]MTV33276.1 hypothetical protein [Rhodoblastus acidophilus]
MLKLIRLALRALQHAREELVGQQIDVFSEHAEDQPVDEVRDLIGSMAASA